MHNSLSSYWLTDTRVEKGSPEYLLRLSSIRRAIANFVTIVTGEDIPVKFSTGQQSYTSADANIVLISATDDPPLFDANVRLALHEAAHLILTKRSKHPGSIPVFTLLKTVRATPALIIPREVLDLGEKCGRTQSQVGQDVGKILNILEDRRIDKWMYQNALGYRGYYDAMYELYWQSADTEALLADPLSRRRLVKCYMFHLCNMTNQAADPSALPGLQKIWSLVNLPNIERFAHDPRWTAFEKAPTSQAFTSLPEMAQVAIKIAETVYRYSDPDADAEEPEEAEESEADPSQKSQGGGQPSKPDPDNWDIPEPDVPEARAGNPGDVKTKKSRGSLKTEEDIEEEDIEDADDGDVKEDTKARDAIDEALETEVPLEELEEADEDLMDILEEVGAEVKHVGEFKEKAKVIVFHKLTKSLLASPAFPFSFKTKKGPEMNSDVRQAVTRGTQMGTLLATRLSVLADESLLTYTRQRAGKLDKRLIAGLGYDQEAVFNHSVVEQREPIEVHVTLDSSGSMGGQKWWNTMALAVALAKAATMLPTLHVTISLRMGGHDGFVYVLMAFDSRVDEFQHVSSLFPFLNAGGSTPEGLAFEAIKETILKNVAQPRGKKFFVNVSDGMPEFGYAAGTGYAWYEYSGAKAHRHTARQVRDLQDFGFDVLSYFVSHDYGGAFAIRGLTKENPLEKAFRVMYGAAAQFIDVKNVNDIARTLNKLFLS